MLMQQRTTGHLAAIVTVFVWGTTFISTKILLEGFQPVEILFFRFILGFMTLLIARPRRLRLTDKKQEIYYALAGICGVSLYFLLENIALTYTSASNVGVIVSMAPFFTALFSRMFLKEERLSINFFIGFVVAIVGISLISFQGTRLELNPKGDLLALGAAVLWACYSILTRKIGEFGYHTVLNTRRIFFYGIIFMIPAVIFMDFRLDLQRFYNPLYLGNILFLGLGASALCFGTWNFTVKLLGVMRTSVYIYLIPVITVITSVLILNETVTVLSAVGIAFTLSGLFLSERRKEPFR